MSSLTIFVDTREQKPFEFPRNHKNYIIKRKRKKLPTGDYIPLGFGEPRGGIVVERKSYNDFLACVTKGARLDHFQKQLDRLSKWTRGIVVVEGNLSLCRVGIYSERRWTPLTLLDRVAELQATFGVPIMFLERRAWAELFTLDFILHSMDSIMSGDATWDLIDTSGGKRLGSQKMRRKPELSLKISELPIGQK